MKKAITLALALILTLTLAACGGNSTPSGGSATTTPPANNSTPATFSEQPAQSQADTAPTGNSQSGWRDMAAVVAGDYHTVGLKKDGTVVAVGKNNYGQCDVSDWTDITSIAAGMENTVGLKKDGTCVAAGRNDVGQCDVSDWTDITAIWAAGMNTVGRKSDGTFLSIGSGTWESNPFDFSQFTDIKDIALGDQYCIGLKNDGSCVVASGKMIVGFISVEDILSWSDIASIFTGGDTTSKMVVGVKNDGTCVISGRPKHPEDFESWKDLVAVSIGANFAFGLKKDGTVNITDLVTTGRDVELAKEMNNWDEIVALSSGMVHFVGQKKDGTVIAIGENRYGECDVQ